VAGQGIKKGNRAEVSWPWILVLVGLLGGTILDHWLAEHGWTVSPLVGSGAALGAAVCWWWRGRGRRVLPFVLRAPDADSDPDSASAFDGALNVGSILHLLVWCGVGAAWHGARWQIAADHLVHWAPPWRVPAAVRGEVVSAVERLVAPGGSPIVRQPMEVRTRFACRVNSVRDAGRWRAVRGTVDIVCQGQLDDLWPGDQVVVVGELSRLSRAKNPGERDSFLAGRLRGRPCVVWGGFPACVRRLDRPRWATARNALACARQWADQALRATLGEEHGLASALLLGLRYQVAPSQLDTFRTTGLMHLLALSGMHVMVLVGAGWGLVRAGWCSPRTVACWAWWITWIYALMTEAQAPILRATLLVQLVCWSVWCRRVVSRDHMLVLAAVGVVVWDPRYVFQVGTWLSFLAVYVLSESMGWTFRSRPADPLERLALRSRGVGWLSVMRVGAAIVRGLCASITVWLMTLPLAARSFHVVSCWAPLLNLLAALPVTVAMFSGLALIASVALIPLWAGGFAAICGLSLKMLMTLLRSAEHWPGGSWWVAGPTFSAVVVFYLLLAAGWWLRRRSRLAWTGLWLLAVLAIVAISKYERRPSGARWECWVLSVGHGACAIMQSSRQQTILIDAGTQGDVRRGLNIVSAALWHLGVSRIDAVLVSHADADHFNLVPGLLTRFDVGQVIVPQGMLDSNRDSPLVNELARELQEHRVELSTVGASDRLSWAHDLQVDILHPPRDAPPVGYLTEPDDNAQSLVLSVRGAKRAILFPGDLAPPGLEMVLQQPGQAWDVVVAPHHGSRHSRPAEFARWSRAKWWIVSGDRRDVAGLRELIDAPWPVQVLHTANCGATHIVCHADGRLIVETFAAGAERQLEGMSGLSHFGARQTFANRYDWREVRTD
jgi:competence protein ComEC